MHLIIYIINKHFSRSLNQYGASSFKIQNGTAILLLEPTQNKKVLEDSACLALLLFALLINEFAQNVPCLFLEGVVGIMTLKVLLKLVL